MRFYFEEIVKGIDLRKETRRLDKVQFATEAAVRQARPTPLPPKPEPTPAERTLEEAEQCYTRRELERASQLYRRLLEETAVRPVQARAYYGLARIAALQKDHETAEKLFQRTLESSPEAPVKAWAHVYLGRLAEAAGEREGSARHFRAAMAVEGASQATRGAAQKGLAQAYPKPSPPR